MLNSQAMIILMHKLNPLVPDENKVGIRLSNKVVFLYTCLLTPLVLLDDISSTYSLSYIIMSCCCQLVPVCMRLP